MRRAAAVLLLALAPAYAAAAPARGVQKAAAMDEAKGRFEVEIRPASPAGAPVTRMALQKRWSGDIEGTSSGEMLSYGSRPPATPATWRWSA